jgi:MFS family permease
MNPTLAATSSRTHERRWWILAVLCLSLSIIGLDNTILNVAIPTIQQEFAATGSELQWIVDSYILVFAGLLLTMGTLGDRFGRNRALQAGLVIFGIASLGAAYADSSAQLIVGRSIMGVGGALIMPATLSIIINVFPREERGRAIAIWAGVSGAAIGLGPLLGGLLLEYFWWGSVLLINVPIVIVALVAGWLLIPESKNPSAGHLDLTGAALSIAAISVLLLGIIEAPTHGWLDPLVLLAFAGAVILGIGFASGKSELRHRCSISISSGTFVSPWARVRSRFPSSPSSAASSPSPSTCNSFRATPRSKRECA